MPVQRPTSGTPASAACCRKASTLSSRRSVDEAADHDDIVEEFGAAEDFLRLNGNAAARRNRLQVGGNDFPSALNRPTTIAFIRSEAQYIQKVGEGAKRKTIHQNKPHRQTGILVAPHGRPENFLCSHPLDVSFLLPK